MDRVALSMRALILACAPYALLFACGANVPQPNRPKSDSQPSPATTRDSPTMTNQADQRSSGSVSGRVLLAQKPVPVFGVIFANQVAIDAMSLPMPHAVVSEDGRFAVNGIPPGEYTIVIAGPGFERKQIPRQSVSAGVISDLGDIHVNAGHVVDGIVSDQNGRPVNGASVRIVQSITSDSDELYNIAMGNFLATTNSSGYYRLTGVYSVGRKKTWQLSASTVRAEASLSTHIRNATQTVNIVIEPTGVVSGTVEGLQGGFVEAMATARRDAIATTRVNADGSFMLQLPAGQYDVRVLQGGGRYRVARINVVSGVTTLVDFSQQP